MTVVRTDKEARLKSFIVDGLASGSDVHATAAPMTVLVRNPDSPVARALYAAFVEGLASSAGLRVILGEALQEEPAQASILDVAGAEIRFIGDARFGAAHEQLVVGDAHVWIGDCLRRDPTKRDAFEIYHAGDHAIRQFATASFRNMWAIAKPLIRAKTETVTMDIIATGQAEEPNARARSHRQ